MSADQRDPFPSLQLGELRTFGLSSASESNDMQRLRIERIDVRDVKLQTPLGSLNATSVALSNVTVRRRTAPPVRYSPRAAGDHRARSGRFDTSGNSPLLPMVEYVTI